MLYHYLALKKNAQDIENFAASGDIHAYTIAVHALKSAACEACDLPALDSLVEKMEQLPLPKDLLEQVAIAVENIDFDAVQELAHTMDADA